ncbi:MAG: DUF3298 and DUF4163 domain-containing protein [Tannerellaceae bacterium]|jgi:hypothetical protein|nr:DUF3298 and DUF4163 domain-containing protein [Tannerellaceae bacterium]
MRNYLCWAASAILLASFWFAGCNFKTKTAFENDIKWDSIHIEKTYHLQENPDNPNCNLLIKFIFPVKYENQAVLESIQQHFNRSCFGEPYEKLTPGGAIERYVEQYIDEYKSLESDFLAEKKEEHDHEHEGAVHSWFSYYEYFANEITYNKNDLLCYAVSYENYTGGAHGSHSYMSYVIDLKTGLSLKEKDFFVEGYQEPLSKILVKKIAEKNRAKDVSELENMGFFSIDEIYPNDNFSIDDNGITYYFNEYEIAAYVVGITQVFLPYDEIRHLLSNDNRITWLAGNQ